MFCKWYVEPSSDFATLTVTGDASTGGDLTVTGTSELTGDVTVTGDLDVTTNLSVTGTSELTGDVTVTGEINTAAWQTFGGSSSVGWSAFSFALVNYKKVGNLVFVAYEIDGTSNSTTTSFTVPYTSANVGGLWFIHAPGECKDNGTINTALSRGTLTGASVTVLIDLASVATNWTASGNKVIKGQFFYEAV